MPSHSIILSAANSPAAYTLSYSEQPTGKTQRRFQNRICLQPEIDLKAYSCRAVIDWVDVRFRTVDHTQRKWIKHHIDRAIGEKIFSEKKKADDDGKYREFRVRIQEPVTQELLLAEEVVRAKWGLQQPAEIIGLEVSVDWTPRKQSDEALALMFGVVTRSHLPSRDIMTDSFDRPRFTWAKGDDGTAYVLGHDKRHPDRSDAFLLDPTKDRPATIDSTYYAGAKGSRPAWRTMIKILDKQNVATGTREVLPRKNWRVRIEVTVDENELSDMGIRTIKDLAGFKFQRFHGAYFKFVLPTFPDMDSEPEEKSRLAMAELRQVRLQRFLNAGVVGLEAWDEAWSRKKQHARKKAIESDLPLPMTSVMAGSSSTLLIYDELTRSAIQALRHIGDRMRLKGPPRRAAASVS